METCIRFKDLSEDDDAEQNQEYDDEELGPVYAEDNNNKDIASTPISKKNEEYLNLTSVNNPKGGENYQDTENDDTLSEKSTIANDDTMTDQQLRQGISDTKSSDRTKGISTIEGSSTAKVSSSTQNQAQSTTNPTELPKVTNQAPKHNFSNNKALNKPPSKLKRKKHTQYTYNNKHGINLTSKVIKQIDKKAAAPKLGKKITVFHFAER